MRNIISILVGWMFIMTAGAQDMKTVFINMPDSIMPLLTKVNREDCVDFLASDMKAVVRNRFGENSEMKEMTDDYLCMQVTDVSSLQMKLLPLNDSVKVICMVKTVCAVACDSEIRFFDTRWKELSSKDYVQLPAKDFFYQQTDLDDDERVEILNKADLYLKKISLSNENTELLVEYTTPLYLNKDDRGKLQKELKEDPVILEWVNGCFQIKA